MLSNLSTTLPPLTLFCLTVFLAASGAQTQATGADAGKESCAQTRSSKRQIWIGGISPFMQRHRKIEAWVNNVVQRCAALAADPRFAPDDLIDQTWETLPTKMTPENAPGTMTNEAKRLLALP